MGTALQGGGLNGLASATCLPDRSALEAEAKRCVDWDAAHVIPPYAGEGVNMAMLDALVLSKFLLSEDTLGDAIAAYEAEMFARMRSMTADTMINTEMFYAPDASHRVVALFRSFGGGEATVPPAGEA